MSFSTIVLYERGINYMQLQHQFLEVIVLNVDIDCSQYLVLVEHMVVHCFRQSEIIGGKLDGFSSLRLGFTISRI